MVYVQIEIPDGTVNLKTESDELTIEQVADLRQRTWSRTITTATDSYTRSWSFLLADMIAEEEEEPRLSLWVEEASEQEYTTTIEVDGLEMIKSTVVAEDKNLALEYILLESDSRLYFTYHLEDAELFVTVTDLSSEDDAYDASFDFFCDESEEICYSPEQELFNYTITVVYQLDTISGIIKEIVRFIDEGVVIFTQVDFLGKQ